MPTPFDITIIGAGLAGCEAAHLLAEQGLSVRLIEQKPIAHTPAQKSDALAELVCSNSLRSANPHNAVGLLKEEMQRVGSLIVRCAWQHRVPAGDALAVDRERFAAAIEQAIGQHPRIVVQRRVVDALPPASEGPTLVATGPLTAPALASDIARHCGKQHLAFYDAIAPIIAADGIDEDIVFAASRWDKGASKDYLNCPLDEGQYTALLHHLRTAPSYPAHDFEAPKYFQGCQPIEVIAGQGDDTLRFGPLKPAGLTDPRTGRWPYAVVQLRAEDHERQAYNLVGMQTKLLQPAQREMLQRIPGLKDAVVLRYGAMHRNTYLDAPAVLDDRLQLRTLPHVRFAGQVTGVEGYVESAACGLICALMVLGERHARLDVPLPDTSALGALLRHITGARRLPNRPHEPQNVNWGMFPATQAPRGRNKKLAVKHMRVARARAALTAWGRQTGWPVAPAPIEEDLAQICAPNAVPRLATGLGLS